LNCGECSRQQGTLDAAIAVGNRTLFMETLADDVTMRVNRAEL
jgi:hypothetical protein